MSGGVSVLWLSAPAVQPTTLQKLSRVQSCLLANFLQSFDTEIDCFPTALQTPRAQDPAVRLFFDLESEPELKCCDEGRTSRNDSFETWPHAQINKHNVYEVHFLIFAPSIGIQTSKSGSRFDLLCSFRI